MNKCIKHLLICLALLQIAGRTQAQGPGSTETSNGTYYLSDGNVHTIIAESVYYGPEADWTVNGTLEIYAKNVWIAPGAKLSGTGTIEFHNPSDAGGASSATLIDDNNNPSFIDLNISLLNPEGIVLTDIADPGYGTDNPGNATLNIGKDLSFDADSHLTLNGSDLVIDNDGTLSNYSSNRMIITGNSIAAHVVKQSYNTAFTFPVGITAGNYSPVTLTPTATTTTHVSVQDFDNTDVTVSNPSDGVGLVWHVYADAAVNSAVTLQHNTSGEVGYNDEAAFITQYLGGGNWTSGLPSDYVSPGVHTNAGIALDDGPSENGAWFSIVNEGTSLPVRLTDFTVRANGSTALLSWITASEAYNSGFGIERSADSHNWTAIDFVASKAGKGGSSQQKLFYSMTDDTPFPGRNYYRLKQVDYDGKFTYSPVKSVVFSDPADIGSYPNPTNGMLTITGTRDNDRILVHDAKGRLIMSQFSAGSVERVDLSTYSPGIYILSIYRYGKLVKQLKTVLVK